MEGSTYLWVCGVPLIVFHNLNGANLVLIIVASVTGSASVNFVKWEDFFTMNAKGTNAFTWSRSYWLSAWVIRIERRKGMKDNIKLVGGVG